MVNDKTFDKLLKKLLLQNRNDSIALCKEITLQYNANNLTRTNAYRHLYTHEPKLEWSLLACSVSRNAGYSMKDMMLYFTDQLGEKRSLLYFQFYERANWYIFADAFPQLLFAYWLMNKKEKEMAEAFIFPVSNWMKENWSSFLQVENRQKLVRAQIVNEQCLLEVNVIQNSVFADLLKSFSFIMSEFLSMQWVIQPGHEATHAFEVHGFKRVSQRITFGYLLYHSLFSQKGCLERVEWQKTTNHTGDLTDVAAVTRWDITPDCKTWDAVVPYVSQWGVKWNDFDGLCFKEGSLSDVPLEGVRANRSVEDYRHFRNVLTAFLKK
ncbi:MAG: DUF2515 family protein [Bacilli bacterium]